MRTLGSFDRPGPMKSRSRSCSATALAALEVSIRRSAARPRRPLGSGHSSRNAPPIAVCANTKELAHERREARGHASRAGPLRRDRISRCQTAACCSFPRRIVASGFVLVIASIPQWRGGRSADRRTSVSCRVCETRLSARVRRGASHDAGRSPLGAPPWRFSAGGRASISGISSGSVQRCSSQPGHHAWRAVSRTSRARGYEPRPQDATPRSAFQDRLRKTPVHERGWESLYYKFIA